MSFKVSITAPRDPHRLNHMTVLVIQIVFRAYDGLRKQTESGDGLKVQRLLQHKENHTKSARNELQKVCYSCKTWRNEKAPYYTIEVNLVQVNNLFFPHNSVHSAVLM